MELQRSVSRDCAAVTNCSASSKQNKIVEKINVILIDCEEVKYLNNVDRGVMFHNLRRDDHLDADAELAELVDEGSEEGKVVREGGGK